MKVKLISYSKPHDTYSNQNIQDLTENNEPIIKKLKLKHVQES